MTGSNTVDLVEMITDAADGTPARRPIFAGNVSLTHGAAGKRIAQTRGLFAELGLGADARIIIASADDAAVTTLYGATLTSGMTAVVLDPGASAAELTVLIERVEPAAIFADTAAAERSLAVSRRLNAPVLRVEPLESRRNAFGLLLRGNPRAESPDSYPAMLDGKSETTPVTHPAPGDTALILFTSGTTSEPKGVEITFGNLGAQMATFRRHYGIADDAIIINHLPLHHSDGLNQGPLQALANGATIVRPGPVSIHTLGQMLDGVYQNRASHLVTVPTVLGMILMMPEEYDDSFRHPEFQFIASTAGPLDEGIWREVEARFDTMVVNSYGLTETCCEAFYCGPTAETRRLGTIGKPIDCEAMLVDADGQPLAEGEPGEIWLRGSNIMAGYFNAPEATRAVLDAEGWLRTGDVATCDADGFYRIVGRKKSVILRGGINVYPDDVTSVLLAAPGVAAAAAVGLPDPILGERVIGCVVPAGDTGPDLPLEIMEHCRAQLSPEKVPDRIVPLETLPYGPSGKVEIASLRRIVAGNDDRTPAGGTDLVGKVLAVAADAFAVAQDSLSLDTQLDDTSVFDSLRYLEFIMSLERAFRIRLSPRETMAMTRIEDAVAAVERHIDSQQQATGTGT